VSRERVSYIGITSAFQADERGSTPLARSGAGIHGIFATGRTHVRSSRRCGTSLPAGRQADAGGSLALGKAEGEAGDSPYLLQEKTSLVVNHVSNLSRRDYLMRGPSLFHRPDQGQTVKLSFRRRKEAPSL
jgi:hypothetical protein